MECFIPNHAHAELSAELSNCVTPVFKPFNTDCARVLLNAKSATHQRQKALDSQSITISMSVRNLICIHHYAHRRERKKKNQHIPTDSFTASITLGIRKLHNLQHENWQFILRDDSFHLEDELKTVNIFCFLPWQLGQKTIWVTRRLLPLHILLDKRAFKDSCHWKSEIAQINCEHPGQLLINWVFRTMPHTR